MSTDNAELIASMTADELAALIACRHPAPSAPRHQGLGVSELRWFRQCLRCGAVLGRCRPAADGEPLDTAAVDRRNAAFHRFADMRMAVLNREECA